MLVVISPSMEGNLREADIGAVAARTLTEDGHGGREYPMTGPDVLDMPRKLAVLADALGREIEFVELSEAEARGGQRCAASLPVAGSSAGTTPHPRVARILVARATACFLAVG
ncbi:hypothetical protein DMH08_21095 [Actinomadura sp. WAC 06369]|nr:hypothetical protein DMH08_21095 [Actinomadura sp. WAC 06369]